MASYIKKEETPASLEILTDIFVRYELLLNPKNLDVNTVMYAKYFDTLLSKYEIILSN